MRAERLGRKAHVETEPLASARFDHVLLWVRNERASKHFYVDKLGFKLLNDDRKAGLYTVKAPGGLVIMFHEYGVDEDRTGLSVEATGTRNVHFDFHVKDIGATYSTLLQRGVAFIKPPRDMPWGERHTWLYDPDGYIIGIWGPLTSRRPTRKG